MFFHFVTHAVAPLKVSDHPGDPLNRKIEFYQTWHLSVLDPLVPPDAAKATWARMGFSVRGAPNSGVSIGANDNKLTIVDPQVAFGLDDDATKTGAIQRFRLDVHNWESDSSSEKVRAAFSDATLNYLVKAWKAAGEDSAKARQTMGSWLSANWKEILQSTIVAAGASGPWVAVGLQLLPAVEMLIELIKNERDDYWDMHRFIIEVKATGTTLQWRVVPPDGEFGEWKEGQGLQQCVLSTRDAAGRNELDITYRFRMIQ